MTNSEKTPQWVDHHLARHELWRDMSDDDFIDLVAGALLRYGSTRNQALVPHLFPLLTRFCDEYGRDVRLDVLSALKPLLDEGVLHATALLPFVICDTDQKVVSSATLDLLAYSPVHTATGLPHGVVELLELTEKKVPRALGFVLGGLVVYGDSRLRASMDAVAQHCSDKEIADAARCQSGFIMHAAADFWLSMCEGLQKKDGSRGSESRFGCAASALVNLVRGSQQPVVFDVTRNSPAPEFESPIELRRKWSIDEYAQLIRPRLQVLADRESGEKIIHLVMTEWGLRYKGGEPSGPASA
jgi:hypothetical protein